MPWLLVAGDDFFEVFAEALFIAASLVWPFFGVPVPRLICELCKTGR